MRTCLICLTPETVRGMDVHHLVKRSQGGYFGPTADLCRICHDFVDNGDWEIYVNDKPVGMDTVLAGKITVYKTDGSFVVETWHNIPTPSVLRPLFPGIETMEKLTTAEIAEGWNATSNLEMAAFAYQCLLAAYVHKMSVRDERWLRALSPYGGADWAKMMQAQISEAIGHSVSADTLRQRATVWETLEEEHPEFDMEQLHDYIMTAFSVSQAYFTKAAWCDRTKGWTMTKALEWVNEEELSGHHLSLKAFEKAIGYRKTELDVGRLWLKGERRFSDEWDVFTKDKARKEPIEEAEELAVEAKIKRLK